MTSVTTRQFLNCKPVLPEFPHPHEKGPPSPQHPQAKQDTGPISNHENGNNPLPIYAALVLPASNFLVTAINTSKAISDTMPTPMYAYHR